MQKTIHAEDGDLGLSVCHSSMSLRDQQYSEVSIRTSKDKKVTTVAESSPVTLLNPDPRPSS